MFWIEATIDCLLPVTELLVSIVATQIEDRQENFSVTAHFRLAEPLKPLCGTQFEKRCSRRFYLHIPYRHNLLSPGIH